MIVYLDSSALVKRYVLERGTDVVRKAVAGSDMAGMAEISRAEVSAALAKAVRMEILEAGEASACRRAAHEDWRDLARIQVTEAVAARADDLAWELGLRGYDAVQLACAESWREGLGTGITLATFDRQLWDAARLRGFTVVPEAFEPPR